MLTYFIHHVVLLIKIEPKSYSCKQRGLGKYIRKPPQFSKILTEAEKLYYLPMITQLVNDKMRTRIQIP